MVYRTEIKIKPADLTDLTVTTDLSSWNLEQFTIEDNALIGDISTTDNTANVTISSTGYITQTIAFSDIPPTIYLMPANEVETLSDGTNSYPIADKMARLMLEDKADISDIPTKTSDLTNDSNFATVSQIPTNNNQLTNGAGYITGINSSDVTTALGYTPANDGDVLKTTGNQNSSGEKGFQLIKIGDTSEYKVDMHKTTNGDYVLVMFNQNNSAWLSYITYNKDGSIALSPSTYITAPTPATSDNSTKIATTAYVKNQEYITTTTKTVADGGCTFVLSNGQKIITTEIQISANTDYSWSYGTTFTNVPKIFIARRTGASTDTGVYTPWVRGAVGKSSCTIFNVNSGTVMLMAIGN